MLHVVLHVPLAIWHQLPLLTLSIFVLKHCPDAVLNFAPFVSVDHVAAQSHPESVWRTHPAAGHGLHVLTVASTYSHLSCDGLQQGTLQVSPNPAALPPHAALRAAHVGAWPGTGAEESLRPFPERPIHDWERVCHTLVFAFVLPVNVLPVSAVQGPVRLVVEISTLYVFTHSSLSRPDPCVPNLATTSPVGILTIM